MEGKALNTLDMSKEASSLWTSKTKALIDQPKFLNQVGQIMNPDGSKFWVQSAYYACVVPREELMDAVKLVVGEMNYLTHKGLVHGFMSDVVALPINDFTTDPKVVVVCYPMVTEETYRKMIKKNVIQDEITIDFETRGLNE